MARMLLGEGADMHMEKVNNLGFTPLLMACDRGHNAIVKLLLATDEGANITAEVIIQGQGYTPLIVPCK